MDNCVFCKIISGDLPANILYEDEKVLVILDAFPQQEGHSLIITKEHYKDICDINKDSAMAVMEASRIVAPKLIKVLEADALNVIQNNGQFAGQEVFHYHMHLVPRFKGRGKQGNSEAFNPTGYEYKASKEDLVETANRIKDEL